jgi:hypothetical protein
LYRTGLGDMNRTVRQAKRVWRFLASKSTGSAASPQTRGSGTAFLRYHEPTTRFTLSRQKVVSTRCISLAIIWTFSMAALQRPICHTCLFATTLWASISCHQSGSFAPLSNSKAFAARTMLTHHSCMLGEHSSLVMNTSLAN